MDFTEADVYEALGLSVPETGVQVQDPADPADQPSQAATAEGAQVQDPADPAAGADDNVQGEDPREPGAVSADDNAGDGSEPGKEPLTPQQRRENAARRRQQEQQAAIDAAVQAALKAEREKHNQQMQGFFAQAGLKHPETNEPITSMEQFEQWRSEHAASQLRRDLKDGKLTPEILQQVLNGHPAIQRLMQQQKVQDAQQKAQQEAADKARINAEIQQISQLDPSITSVNDFLTMPKADVFREYVRKGYSFLDAFRLTHWERLEQQKVDAAKQQALNNAHSKDHLKSVSNSRSAGMVEVPADVLSVYRAINPRATDAEIQAHYNKNLKR